MKTKRGVWTRGRKNRLLGGLLILIASVIIARFNFTQAAVAELEHPEDWNLELVFFDSTVNQGKDPITNVNWTINGEDLAFSATESRTITMQVNYKNANVDRTYERGELQITVPNPYSLTKRNSDHAQLDLQLAVGANSGSQNEYDWDYNSGSYNNGFVFTNRTPIEALTNVEGSIQVVYYLTSRSENQEKYEDSCTHSDETLGMKAILNNVVESNTAETHFTRTYIHPWQRATYFITKTASKIVSLDNLGDGASDYTWVKYRFGGRSQVPTNMYYWEVDYLDYIGLKNYSIRDKFPTGLKIQNANGVAIEQDSEGYIDVSQGTSVTCSGISYGTCFEIYVGYPKSVYNEEAGNLEITNKVELRGTYSDRNEEEALADDTITLNLAEFAFDYIPGNLVGITKSFCSNILGSCSSSTGVRPYYYQDIVRAGSTGTFYNTVSANYSGQAYDIEVGDDLVYYADTNGGLTRLSDDDYYVSQLVIPRFRNKNGAYVENEKYHPSVYVRYRGANEFVKYGDYETLTQTINFTEEQHVQAWYVEIKGLTESIYSSSNFSTRITLKSQNLSRDGTIYNFDYVKYIIDGAVQNYWTIDSYNNELTRDTIAPYDQATYGHYLQRSWAQASWEYHDIGEIKHYTRVYKDKNTANPTFSPSSESFKGYYYFYVDIGDYSSSAFDNMELNREQMEDSDYHHEINYYDLLPLGVELNGTAEDIINSAGSNYCSNKLYKTDGSLLFENKAACIEYGKTHSTVTITKNWRNTGRTHVKIHVDYSENPFTTMRGSCSNSYCFDTSIISFRIPYEISYDSYVENGRTYRNRVYMDTSDYAVSTTKDNGSADEQESDINGNGSTEDYIAYNYTDVNLLSATSTRQDIQTSVLTEHNGKYDTDPAQSGMEEDYSYKLRVRTGSNKVTNLVIYNHIEEEHGDNKYWQGGFVGVDTSDAESRLDYYDNPIQVKVYWSPNPDTGPLSEDQSWQEYDEATVDKSLVRSLAFQYLDQEGNPAIMTQQFYSYVLVNMKAPDDEDIYTLAYNNSHSEWNAIDNLTGELIYDITGIDSNTVKVFLRDKFDLNVTKQWSDFNNYYNIRPDTLTFNVMLDGNVVASKEMNIANGETQIKFEGLDTANQDRYSIVEASVAEYTSTSTQDENSLAYTFTNTITRETPKFDLIAKKEWSDFNNYYNIRPNTVTFSLVKSGNVVDTKTLDVANGAAEVKFEGLDALIKDQYSIEEAAVTEYTSRFTFNSETSTYTFTNTINRETPKFNLTAKKVWSDFGDYYQLRPDTITFNLVKDNAVVDTKTLNVIDGETEVKFEGLDALAQDSYSIEEAQVTEYTSSFVKDDQTLTYTFTNTINREAPKFNLTAKKVWEDFDNYYQLRPNTITFNLVKDGAVVDSKDLDITAGEAEVKFEGLDALAQDSYSIEEAPVDGYISRSALDDQELVYTFTNTIDRDEPKFSLSVKKVWSDYDNYYKIRPDKIAFNLYKGDDVIETKKIDVAAGETEVVFEDLKALEQDQYRVEEVEVSYYTSSFVLDEDTLEYTFTNTVNREAPKPEPNANTNDGVKIFFVAGGVMAGIIAAGGLTAARATRRRR